MTPHITPTTPMLNRIEMLQTVANSFGFAVAMKPNYEPETINKVSTELSDIIVAHNGGN